MMARNTAMASLLSGFLLLGGGIACGAKPLSGDPDRKTAAPAPAEQTPELAAASERVVKAKEQWETAKKQLEAARALLRAAEADYKAAVTERQALELKTKAQGLADASGLAAAKANAPAQPGAQPLAQSAKTTPDPASPAIQQSDFNAEPAQPDSIQQLR